MRRLFQVILLAIATMLVAVVLLGGVIFALNGVLFVLVIDCSDCSDVHSEGLALMMFGGGLVVLAVFAFRQLAGQWRKVRSSDEADEPPA